MATPTLKLVSPGTIWTTILFQENDNQIQGHFEDVGDLNEVQQENFNQGWEQPPPPPPG
jgi:hypothetical protein